MALILKISLFSVFALLVHAQGQDENALDLVAFTRLLRTAARLAYPVTTRLNNVVGNLRDIEAIPLLLNVRPNKNPTSFGHNRQRTDFQNIRRANLPARNSQDISRRYPHTPTYYNYDDYYEYDLDEDYTVEEADDELELKHPKGVILLSDLLEEEPNHKSIPPKLVKARPTHIINDGRVYNKPVHHQPSPTAPGNVLPGSKDAQPKIIYVVVNPGEVTPEMMKDNSIVLNKHDLATSAVNPHVNVKQAAVKPRA